MDRNMEGAAVAVLVFVIVKHRSASKKWKERSVWVRPWLQMHAHLGAFDTLLNELRLEDEEGYRRYLQMYPEIVDEVLHLILNHIQGQ